MPGCLTASSPRPISTARRPPRRGRRTRRSCWTRPGSPASPNGSLGFRFSDSGEGRWNLDLGDADPLLSVYGRHERAVPVDLARFDVGETEGGSIVRRGVPTTRVADRLVTTVFDLLMAQYAVGRDGLPGEWPTGYDDATTPCTPAWQETITSVPAGAAARVAREFARNAELSRGRSMIAMGAGTNHWYHSDQIYRTFFTLIMLCGCQGVNGGGWAHYVGQEKVRPLTGFQNLAFALDWQRPTRHMTGTSFFYLHSDQWRYEGFDAAEGVSPLGRGIFSGRAFVDCLAQASRLGWTPSHPTFDRNPLDVADDAARAGKPVAEHIVDELRAGRLRFADTDPDNPRRRPAGTCASLNSGCFVAVSKVKLCSAASSRGCASASARSGSTSSIWERLAKPHRSGAASGSCGLPGAEHVVASPIDANSRLGCGSCRAMARSAQGRRRDPRENNARDTRIAGTAPPVVAVVHPGQSELDIGEGLPGAGGHKGTDFI